MMTINAVLIVMTSVSALLLSMILGLVITTEDLKNRVKELEGEGHE